MWWLRRSARCRSQVTPGVTTAELDEVSARVFAKAGARSGPRLDYGFPGTSCISVNDEAVHGIPGGRVLRNGDLVKLDVTAELDGFYADACVSVAVGTARVDATACRRSRRALTAGIGVARARRRLNEIGHTVETKVEARKLGLRGTDRPRDGRRIHEPPNVPHLLTIHGLAAAHRRARDDDRADHRGRLR